MRKIIFLLLVALVIAAGVSGFLFIEAFFLSVLAVIVLVINYYHSEPGGYLVDIMDEVTPRKMLKKYLSKKRAHAYSILGLNLRSLYDLNEALDKYGFDLSDKELEQLELLKKEIAKKIDDKEKSRAFFRNCGK